MAARTTKMVRRRAKLGVEAMVVLPRVGFRHQQGTTRVVWEAVREAAGSFHPPASMPPMGSHGS